MAFCAKCGHKLIEGARFCSECGCIVENNRDTHSAREQEYAGKIIKCPNCGEILAPFQISCPACGFVIRNQRAVSSVSELSSKLEAIDNEAILVQKGIFNKRQVPSEELIQKKLEKKLELIRNYPIPNTKEDLYEFLIMASSNIDLSVEPSMRDEQLSNAWKAKYEQAYNKAKISFGNTGDFIEFNEIHKQKEAQITNSSFKKFFYWVAIFGSLVVWVIIMHFLFP